MRFLPFAILAFVPVIVVADGPSALDRLRDRGMTEQGAYKLLKELTDIGPRPSGSDNAAKAVQWGQQTMKSLGFQNVRLVPCSVPHWERGIVETVEVAGSELKLNACALGMSPGTPEDGVTAQVVLVKSVAEAEKLGSKLKGNIVFFTGPMDQTYIHTGGAYGAAGSQRFRGPAVAAKLGAVATIIRSLSTADDDVPHTGVTQFSEGEPKVPAAALGVQSAISLSNYLKDNPQAKVTLKLSCKVLPDVMSANVVGEIVGSTKPNEVVVMGGHLDSWDKGTGAHDDGAGIVHSLEALRLLKNSGLKPSRTIRVVLFMNEEISGTGAAAYLAYAKTEKKKHYAAIESDSGGFAPRGFSASVKGAELAHVQSWLPMLRTVEVDQITGGGGGGADVGPLREIGAKLFGLEPEMQRYFDLHHSDNDTIERVHPRELELGAISMAMLAWYLSESKTH